MVLSTRRATSPQSRRRFWKLSVSEDPMSFVHKRNRGLSAVGILALGLSVILVQILVQRNQREQIRIQEQMLQVIRAQQQPPPPPPLPQGAPKSGPLAESAPPSGTQQGLAQPPDVYLAL